jgi:hypothetical protein
MSMRNVLAVVGDDSTQTRATLETAIGLADRENARLTLAKTCVSPTAGVWAVPFGSGVAYVDPSRESPEDACRAVARIAQDIPRGIPVTTLVLNHATQKALVKLVSGGHFGAVVAEAGLFSRCGRLRRLLAQEDVLAVPVPLGAAAPEPGVTAGAPEDEQRVGARTPGGPLGGYLPGGAALVTARPGPAT